MILRFESNPNEVYILEATGKMGVHLSKYSSIKKHLGPGKFYNKLVLRHLDFDRTDDCLTKLEAFMKQVIGLSYSVNVSKLVRKKTVAMKNNKNKDGEDLLVDENRTFFCSELIAKTYKILEIMEETDVSSAKFMPGDFSE